MKDEMKTEDDDEAYLSIDLDEDREECSLDPGLDPPRNLMKAVLIKAIDDYLSQSKGNKKKSWQYDAETWIFSNEQRYPLSFLRICKALGYDPERIRDNVVKARTKAKGKRLSRQLAINKALKYDPERVRSNVMKARTKGKGKKIEQTAC